MVHKTYDVGVFSSIVQQLFLNPSSVLVFNVHINLNLDLQLLFQLTTVSMYVDDSWEIDEIPSLCHLYKPEFI